MAKRKRTKGAANQAVPSSIGGSRHLSTSIDEVDNGFIVNVSGEGKNGEYSSKRMIAGDKPSALRIANDFLSGSSRKGGKKKGTKSKRIISKRI